MEEKIKVLYTSKFQGFPAVGGPELRTENSIRALNLVCDLFVVSQVTPQELGGEKALEFYSTVSHKFLFSPTAYDTDSLFRKVIRFIKRRTNSLAKHMVKVAHENNINIIWISFGSYSYNLIKKIKKLDKELLIVSDTDSVWSRFVLRGLSCAKNKRKRTKIIHDGQRVEREEIKWTDLCDCVTAVSSVDAEYYKSLTVNQDKVKLFSNVINLNSYDYKKYKDNTKGTYIYLAGSFWGNSPMEYAARWVIDSILPIVWNEYPTLRFYVIGNNSEKVLSDIKDERIHICGRVESVLPYLCNANVALVPLKFESGTRFKILEAGACKIPIVSTTLGAEGIPVEHGKNILLADNEMEFANAIIELLDNSDKAKEIAENCYKLIVEKYSVDNLANEGRWILKFLCDKGA